MGGMKFDCVLTYVIMISHFKVSPICCIVANPQLFTIVKQFYFVENSKGQFFKIAVEA
jgi:hypothetical protein